MKAPVILGGLFFFAGLLIYVGTSFPVSDHANLFGYNIVDQDVHAGQVMASFWKGVSLALMVCGSLTGIFLSRDYSRKGTSV